MSPSVTLPVLWHAPLHDPSGYADEARSFLLSLDRAGFAAAARAIAWGAPAAGLPDAQRLAIERALAREAPADAIVVEHRIPLPGERYGGRGHCTVARTMFETDSIPAHWPAALIGADEIWVPSAFNVETFQRGGLPAERLRILPGTIDFELFAPGAEPWPVAGRRGFTFLTNFDFTDRKGWDVLLDGWAEAFDPDDDVCLLLKCMSLHGLSREDVSARIADHLGGRATAPVIVLNDVLPGAELPRLYAAADAFVLPTRGEGWGRPYMEAMAMGLPTIGSRWSAPLEFMHDGNAWLLDGEVAPVARWEQVHSDLYRGHSWFAPDRDSLVAALREVHAGGAEAEARAGRARAELLERFGPERIAARIEELVSGAVERHRWRASRPAACAWRGGWGSAHSLAVVNDGLAGAVERAGARVERIVPESLPAETPAVGVAGQWPPDFEAPSDGPFVLYQPWEFGEVPAAWVEPIRRRVDEVWTASEYSRQAYLAAGVAPELVHVVPNGVDLRRFAPAGPVWPLPQRAATVFLFVGGTTHRKGFDLLLEAYGRAFTDADDVLLVVKGFGSGGVYRGQTAEQLIAAFRARPGAPALLPVDDHVDHEALPSLYRAADCAVQPYRGEGFCLPALEALACGRPVIVTEGGPTDDFVTDLCAWRLPARRVPVPPAAIPAELRPAGGGFLLEPDVDALVGALRAAADPATREAKAAHARGHAARFSWDAAAAVVLERLEALRGATPIRTVPPAAVPGAKRVLVAVDADWDEPATWAPALDAWAEAFGPDDAATLLLPAVDEHAALARVSAHLAAAAIDADGLADVVLADPRELDAAALELAVDAFVCTGARRPARARRVLPPEPGALRSLLLAS